MPPDKKRRRRRLKRHEVQELPAYVQRRGERRAAARKQRRRRKWRFLKPLSVAAALAGVISIGVSAYIELSNTDEARIQEALAQANSGEPSEAANLLREVLTNNPDNAQARWELGRLLIELRNGAGALKELETAESLGFRHPDLYQSKLVSYLVDGRYAEVIRQLVFVTGEEREAALLEIEARAQFGLGRLDEARARLDELVARGTPRAESRLWLGRVALQQGDVEAAAAQATLLTSEPSPTVEAWVLSGEIALARQQPEKAEISFRAGLAAQRNSVPARLGLARAQLLQFRPENATEVLNGVLKDAPDHPLAKFLLAHATATSGDITAAITHGQQVISRFPKHPPTLLLLGSLFLESNDLAQAELLLRRLASLSPDDVLAQKLLATVELQSGRASDAAERLMQLRDKFAATDTSISALLGAALVRTDKTDTAIEVLEESLDTSEPQPSILTELAFAYLARGELDEGVDFLERAITLDPTYARAYLLFAAAELDRGRHVRAAEKLTALLNRQSGHVAAWHLLGLAQLANNDRASAAQSFQRSLDRDASYVPTHWTLARQALDDGKLDAARAHYLNLLRFDPSQEQARMELALLDIRRADFAAAEASLESVVKANPSNAAAVEALSELYVRDGRLRKAVSVLKDALKAQQPTSLLTRFADVSVASGDYRSAYLALDSVRETDAASKRRTAVVNALLRSGTALPQWLKTKNALSAPEDVLLAKGVDALAKGRIERADAIARQLIRQFPKSTAGETLLGDTFAARNNPAGALNAYSRAAKRQPSRDLVRRIALGWARLDRFDKAEAALTEYLTKRENDVGLQMLRGELALRNNQLDNAIRAYESALVDAPDNAEALNNLAWIYQSRGDARALTFAETAYKVAPDDPNVLDTLGWILVERGQSVRGRKLLLQAVAQRPDNLSMRYHLAVAYSRTEARDKARELLLTLHQDRFPEQADARNLLIKIGPAT